MTAMKIMKEIISSRIKKKRQILFNRDDDVILGLSMIINDMPKEAVVSWALEMAKESLKVLEDKYPCDNRPQRAVTLTELWAKGELKMYEVKGAILECHKMAQDLDSPGDIARCHAIGQACSCMHTIRHAIGYPIYDLTALIRDNGINECDELINKRIAYYEERLIYWKNYYLTSHDKGLMK